MSSALYEALLNEIAVLASVDAGELVASQSLVIDEVIFSFQQESNSVDDFIVFFCDFGEINEENQSAVLIRLLDVNLYLALNEVPSAFSRNAETGHVLLYQRHSMFESDAAAIFSAMKVCAERALTWRDSRFLDQELDEEPIEMNSRSNKPTVVL